MNQKLHLTPQGKTLHTKGKVPREQNSTRGNRPENQKEQGEHKCTKALYRQAESGRETRKELDSKDAIMAQYCNKPNHPRGASKRDGDTYVIDNQQIEWEDGELN